MLGEKVESINDFVKSAQRLRMRRFGMSVATYVVAILATFLITLIGIGDLSIIQWATLIGLCFFGISLFFILFYTGMNLHFSEASLVREQIIYSFFYAVLAMYWLPDARPMILLFFLPPFSFGMLILKLRQYLFVVVCVLSIYAALLGFEYFQDSRGFMVQYQIFLFVLFSLLLTWFAIFGGFVSNIRLRLRTQKEELASLNEKLEERTTELTESNSMKELLLDVIAHDLKNPAGIIKGFAEIGLGNDPTNEILKEIDGGTDNLLNIISKVTTISKVTIGDEIKKYEVNLVKIINDVIKELLPELDNDDMTLNMKLKGELIIKANPIISEVFRNYISNAIKYAKDGRKIVIDSSEKDKFLTVNVKDFGNTIEKEDRKYIFERKVQLDNTKGSGLGLAIVNRIAKAHGAEAGVKPNKPKGNIFYIKIPFS